MADDYKILFALAEAQNWRVEQTSNHIRLYAPSGGFVIAPTSSSDRRGIRNTISEMTKLGFQRPRKHTPKKKWMSSSVMIANAIGIPYQPVAALPAFPYIKELVGQFRTEDWFDPDDGLPLGESEWAGPNDECILASILLEHYGIPAPEPDCLEFNGSIFRSYEQTNIRGQFDNRNDKTLRMQFYGFKYWGGIGFEQGSQPNEVLDCSCGHHAEHGSLGLVQHILPYLEAGTPGHEPEGLLRWYDPDEIETAWAPLRVVELEEQIETQTKEINSLSREKNELRGQLVRIREAMKPLVDIN